jgi:plastocyanin
MNRLRFRGGITSALLIAGLLITSGPVRAVGLYASHTQASRAAADMPTTWHVIAGFSQLLPTDTGNTEAVNQFYPRTLTIYQGDRVTWTVNAQNEVHTVTFAPDPVLRKLEDPQVQIAARMLGGKQQLVVNPAVFFPSSRGPLVERDAGLAKTLLSCGAIGPAGAPTAQSCTIAFPNLGTYAYDCLLHSGIPGSPDMDGVIKVVARPQPSTHRWTVWAGTGNAIDANDGFWPPHLTIHAGDTVTWRSGGVLFHTVSFGIDPRKTALFVPAGTGKQGPILAVNPQVAFPAMPKGGIYSGGVASSGIVGLGGNYVNLPGQRFLTAVFSLTFDTPGTYTYYCLVHAPLMKGTITVLPAGQ